MDKATKDKNLSNEYFVAVMTIALLIRFFAGVFPREGGQE